MVSRSLTTEIEGGRGASMPVVTMRTVFLEGFFLTLAAAGVRASDELALPMGGGKTSPISAVDVARAVAVILDDPAPHIGQIYDLTGPESPIWTTMRALSRRRSAGPSISRRPTPAVERWPSADAVSRTRRQPSLGHDRVEQAGTLAPTGMRDFVTLRIRLSRMSHSPSTRAATAA